MTLRLAGAEAHVRSFCYEVGRLLSGLVLGSFFNLRAYGQANVPRRGGALLLCNHQSFMDPLVVGCPVRRHLFYMARDTLFKVPVLGFLMALVNAFPVKRGRPDKSSIRRAIEHLKAGRIVLMFPEGTRSPDGALQPIKGGFRLLVRRAGVPVIPAALDGCRRAWPRDRMLPRPARVRVIYGRAIPPAEFEGMSDGEAGERMFRDISLLLETLRRLP